MNFALLTILRNPQNLYRIQCLFVDPQSEDASIACRSWCTSASLGSWKLRQVLASCLVEWRHIERKKLGDDHAGPRTYASGTAE